jgi:hypothetical protein
MGRTPRLAIHGYAVVCARNGTIYKHTKNRLPHQVSVDFLQTENPQVFNIGGYGGTIHRLSNPEHIHQVFAPVLGKFSSADRHELKKRKVDRRRDVTLKNVEDFAYSINKRIKVSARHNQLQNRLYQRLVEQYGVQNVLMEKDYVDVQVRVGSQLTLYEVKPFDSPLLCLRDALGQILLYGWRFDSQSGVKLRLIIAGPSKMTGEAKEFLNYLRRRFGKGLEYLALG